MKNFGKRVREARLRYGWTQKTLAGASGLAQSAIGNYESGQRTIPSGAALMKLAQALNVSAVWLSSGEGPMEIGAAAAKPAAPRPARRAAAASPAEWPFQTVPYTRFRQLSAADKMLLESLVYTFIRSRSGKE
ncbi:helix-turn-helix domain-containing protein [Achromobacter aloeverae]